MTEVPGRSNGPAIQEGRPIRHILAAVTVAVMGSCGGLAAVRAEASTHVDRPVISTSASRIDVGDAVALSGRVDPQSRVVLQRRVGSASWQRIGVLDPGATGVIQRTVTPPAGAVGFRVVVRLVDHVRRSAPVLVRVVRPTSVRARHETAAVATGSRISIATWVEPARNDVPVVLQRRVGSDWREVATGRSGPDGGVDLITRAPTAPRFRTVVYRAVIPERALWSRSASERVALSVAPRATPVVDGVPTYFRVGPEVGKVVEVPVELEAGQPVTVEASAVTPGNRAYLDVEVLDPAGERAEPTLIPDTYYGQGVDPATTGTYTVRLSDAGEPGPVSGVLWISTPQEVPIEVDGEPVELADDLRPGQARWLTFDRLEGELFTVGCEPSRCADDLYLVSRESDNQLEVGPVGPTLQAMWNPPRDGAYYLDDDVIPAHRVWLTSADPTPARIGGLPERVDFTRPGQSHGITVDVVEGQQYAVNAIDRGLVDPETERAGFEVAGFAPLGTSGSIHAIHQHGSSLTTFRAQSTGTWTVYLDPEGSAVGPMDLQVVRIDDR